MSIPSQQVIDALTDTLAVAAGTGAHAGHTREQIGRCIHCSCGTRVQGTLPASARTVGVVKPVFEVVLPDGFVSYRSTDRNAAEDRAARRPGATVRQAGAS